MKRLLVLLTLAVFLVAVDASAQLAPTGKPTPGPKPRTTFSDNFNDGNLTGWVIDYGNWLVQDGMLVESPVDQSDYKLILVENLNTASQTIEVMLNSSDTGGAVAFWRLDARNQVEVWLTPYWNRLTITEAVDAQPLSFDWGGDWQRDTWYKLRIDANSATGDVKVWVNNVYLFTYTVQSARRSGMVGLHSGGFGSTWDDFSVQRLRK